MTITLCCGHMVNGADGLPCCRCLICKADHAAGECDGSPRRTLEVEQA